MTNLDAYLDKFSESGQRVLEGALNESRRRQQNFVSPEHILYALIIEESELFNSVMKTIQIDPQFVRSEVEKVLETSRQHIGQGFRMAPETTELFKYSMDRARSEGRRVIEADDILWTFMNNQNSVLNYILQNKGSSQEVEIYGKVRKIDLDAKHFELRNFLNTDPVFCIYRNYSDEEAAAWLNKFVKVRGFVGYNTYQRIRVIGIETVEIE